ncbi:two-component response regulator-like APRR9 isoform X2 [Wolffia australiana]
MGAEEEFGEEQAGGEVRWEKFLPQVYVRVLLVESDDSTRQIIAALLRKCSYRVAAAADGLKAWETLKEKPQNVDLVLTEVELPSMSGYALLTMIMEHESCKNIPVILMSSKDSVELAFKCLLKGAADFLFKPIRKNELQNLWQHVWRRQSSGGTTRENKEKKSEKCPDQKIEPAEGYRSVSHQDKSAACEPMIHEIKNACARTEIKTESTCSENGQNDTQQDCVSSSAALDGRIHREDLRDKSTERVLDAACSSQASMAVDFQKPFTGLDLIGAMDCHVPSPGRVDDPDDGDWKFLELSLDSHAPPSATRLLNHSSSSAFSSTRTRKDPVRPETGDNGSGSRGHSQSSTSVDLSTGSPQSQRGVLTQIEETLRSAHREEALKKYRLKRKDRCFEKKVQYHGRKAMAEKRPRLKGHFVRLRQTHHPQPLDTET